METRYPQTPEKFAWKFLKKYPLAIILTLLINPIVIFIETLIPWMFSRAINWINSDLTRDDVFSNVLEYVWMLAGLCIVCAILNIFDGLYSYYKSSAEVAVDVRKELFKSLTLQSTRFYNKNPAGTLFARLTTLKDNSIQDGGLAGIYLSLYHKFIGILITLLFIGNISIKLAIVLFLFSIFLTYFLSKTSKSVEDKSKRLSKIKSETFGKLVDVCTNYFLIKTFGTKFREEKNLRKEFNKVSNAMEDYHFEFLVHTAKQQIVTLFAQISIILYTIYLWINKTIDVGDVIFIMTTFTGLVLHFRILGYIVLGLKERKGSVKYAIDVFNEPYEVVDGDKKLKLKDGKIEFKNINFSYDGKKDVLHNINLTIAPKEKVGIVGVSGGGKTTLAHLLLRIFDINNGEILIDGQNIKDVSLNSLYKNIGFIPQDTSLFHRSIEENILYGTFKTSDKKRDEIAKQSYTDEFIKKLPDGYNTLVGDKGVKLSGGQRQRVGGARAILKNAPILVLDEATSALDSKSELYIQKSIAEIIKDKTVIAIAHRLSTLREMNRIVVIEDGKIIEEGSPKKLLSKKGKFAKLWKIQMDI
ncbi:MAG: ABC transporter ATP-binding protein [Alphaproteobacteria bacterium]